MEKLVLIQEAGVYSEHQYNKQDGTQEYFRSRGLVMKHGGDTARGRTSKVSYVMRTHSLLLTFKHSNH